MTKAWTRFSDISVISPDHFVLMCCLLLCTSQGHTRAQQLTQFSRVSSSLNDQVASKFFFKMVMDKVKKRKALTVKEKLLELIQELSMPGRSLTQVATKHGIKPSTLAGILKEKSKILAISDARQKSKHYSCGKEHQLEESSWNLVLNRPVVRNQAEVMAKKMNLEILSWLTCYVEEELWRRLQTTSWGASVLTVCAISAKWLKTVLPMFLSQFEPKSIYNCDETGVLYRGISTRGFVRAGERASGTKVAKERLAVLVTTNMDASDKPPLLIVGKSARPRGFPWSLKSFPVKYEASSKAWMNSSFTVLDAVHMLSRAWNSVKAKTISNCFRNAFSAKKSGEPVVNALADVPLPQNMDRKEFDNLVGADVAAGQTFDEEEEAVASESDDDDEDNYNKLKIEAKERLEALAKVHTYCQH